MTKNEIELLHRVAAGPIDGYDVHHAREALKRLLAEHESLNCCHTVMLASMQTLKTLNEGLVERIAAQSEILSRHAEKKEQP